LIGNQIDEEDIVNTFPENKPTPPPPVLHEVLDIVEDNVDIEDELIIDDIEIDDDTDIKIIEILQDDEVEEDEIFGFYDLKAFPIFPFGGLDGINSWIAKNTTYPKIAKEMGITGKVYVDFIIGKDGVVTDVKVLRKVDPFLDKEAIRVIKSMPKWKPGKQRGKPVKVSFQVPINFTISG
jgi:protein TonB